MTDTAQSATKPKIMGEFTLPDGKADVYRFKIEEQAGRTPRVICNIIADVPEGTPATGPNTFHNSYGMKREVVGTYQINGNATAGDWPETAKSVTIVADSFKYVK